MICRPEQILIGGLYTDQNKWDLSPDYQREAGIWSLEKKQLFIDSLLNGFDVPKIYLHDIRDKREPINFYVVDGKQRIKTVLEFLNNDFALAEDFSLNIVLRSENDIHKKMKWADFPDSAKEYLKSRGMTTVMISDATIDDIEEIFQRLNNGEKLNAAEQRNAIGGDMCSLIRDLSQHKFFSDRCAFTIRRYNDYEVTAKLLNIETAIFEGKNKYVDLQKKHLDSLVNSNKDMTEKKSETLKTRINKGLNFLADVFEDKDPSLKKVSYPQLYYLFILEIDQKYGHPNLRTIIKNFFPKFNKVRQENLDLPNEERDNFLMEFGMKTSQGTNHLESMEWRTNALIRFFLKWNPDVEIKDTRRFFNNEERFCIWTRAEKKCEICEKDLLSLEEMAADHIHSHIRGGKTSLKNAQCLCVSCNSSKKDS